MTSHANKIINLTNDIMSLRKELRLGDVHNLVIRIREQTQICLEEAIDEVKRMHDDELKQYLKLEQELLIEKEVKQFMKRFQSSISDIMTGVLILCDLRPSIYCG
ncbi:terpene synthase family protein [Bacillus sp. A015]